MAYEDIQKLIEQEVEKRLESFKKEVFDQVRSKNQYGVPVVPYHVHNGVDSPRIDASTATAGGPSTSIQYNDSGILSGDLGMVYTGSAVVLGDRTTGDPYTYLYNNGNILLGLSGVENDCAVDYTGTSYFRVGNNQDVATNSASFLEFIYDGGNSRMNYYPYGNSGYYVHIGGQSLSADHEALFPNADGLFVLMTGTGTTAPGTTPPYIGAMFIDTTNAKVYVATGTSSSSDWKVLN